MTKKQHLEEINKLQDDYVSKLVDIVLDNSYDLKEINFTSSTGTGKTHMIAKFINRLPDSDFFFIITSLSRGQLNQQIESKIKSLVKTKNFIVFGSAEFKKNTKLQKKDIINSIPKDKKLIWIRDEGHIETNEYDEVIREYLSPFYIINFSATNKYNYGIQCNFDHTMMLRTVHQQTGKPEDALDKLSEIKESHKNVNGYNPCALFRIIHDELLQIIIKECKKRHFNYKNITDENYDISEICKDDNEIDVIINKFKIVEGIDLKRCHVIYMDNKPNNDATTIQIIGRARRNALFWRNDIDIMAKENSKLLENTRQCFIFYNIKETKIDLEKPIYCDIVSVEKFKPNIKINVTNGRYLKYGLSILELSGKSGSFNIYQDKKLGKNFVNNPDFYKKEIENYNPYIINLSKLNIKFYLKKNIQNFFFEEERYNNDIIETSQLKNNHLTICKKKNIFLHNHNNTILDSSFLKYVDKFKYRNQVIHLTNGKTSETIPKFNFYQSSYEIQKEDFPLLPFCSYKKTINDYEIALIGPDIMQYSEKNFIEDKKVTSKIEKYCKFNRFITKKYADILNKYSNQFFILENDFKFNKKCNSCLGFCVEYFAKIKLFGEKPFKQFINNASSKLNQKNINDEDTIKVLAAMEIYKSEMKRCYGKFVTRIIPTIKITNLIKKNFFQPFIDKVIELGNITAEFVRKNVYGGVIDEKTKFFDPILSVNYISALCDFISENTILDLKCTSKIDEKCLKQILSYYYLSTKRTDLHIKKLIIFDAPTQRFIEINL